MSYGGDRYDSSWPIRCGVSRFHWLDGGAGSAGVPLLTFPTFVLPYKRFATPCLLALATKYLSEPRATYRSVVRHERQRIGYPIETPVKNAPTEDPAAPSASPHGSVTHVPSSDTLATSDRGDEEDPYHQRVIPPSLVWRFLAWLGCLTFSLDKAREMILKQDPSSLCHRVSGSVNPFKARSEQRLATLETARQLVQIMSEWEDCFDQPFFPQFATRAGFD